MQRALEEALLELREARAQSAQLLALSQLLADELAASQHLHQQQQLVLLQGCMAADITAVEWHTSTQTHLQSIEMGAYTVCAIKRVCRLQRKGDTYFEMTCSERSARTFQACRDLQFAAGTDSQSWPGEVHSASDDTLAKTQTPTHPDAAYKPGFSLSNHLRRRLVEGMARDVCSLTGVPVVTCCEGSFDVYFPPM